ncbi:MAG: TetR/AcrR family transcriptional regulator, partial [Porticoccaceae bacterium]|nr:TetR/AcrR family transcriptional regulator [Porticoccaceae bacterium]
MTDTHTEEVNVPEQNKPDGRLLRSERSRGLIIDAMIALVEEGFLIPTAQQIAE